MTSIKQVLANRFNARKSTGPRTLEGKRQSRCNALRHGLTAETVVGVLENADDYRALETGLLAEHQPRSATEREMVLRLASVLWRLRRSAKIETGLFQIEAEFIEEHTTGASSRRRPPPPEWYDRLEIRGGSMASIPAASIGTDRHDDRGQASTTAESEKFASCFLRVSGLGYGTFDLLTRYETALWRQASQILYLLQFAARR